MPAAMASAGLRKFTSRPSSRICALVRAVLAVEGLHQRRLAGAVLAHDRVHLAAADPQLDVAVGDHAGEALGDAAQLDGVGARRRRVPRLLRCGAGPPVAAMVGLSPRVRRRVRGARPLVCAGGDGIDRRRRLAEPVTPGRGRELAA